MEANGRRYVISLSCSGKECFRVIAILEFNACISTYMLIDYTCRRMCLDWKCKLPDIASPPCNCVQGVFDQWLEKTKEMAVLRKMDLDMRIDDLCPPRSSDCACSVVSC